MKRLFIILFAVTCIFDQLNANRTFVHPGCSYTQGQLDRMKAMVEAKVEPYYTTYLNLKNSEHASLDRKVSDRGTQIKEGQFNGSVGIDGRCAHDLALLWHITGDYRYADKAVEYLNANNHYTNTSSRGTASLDNGKINLLIEAAELMRDYEGWKTEDQQKFKDMLTYPYYSNSENLNDKYASSNDDTNAITFYWNIFNGDCARYGNQGMFGLLAMLAMGVYLDNELIYERALRYVSGLPHREDDLPYPPGPPITSSHPVSEDEYQKTYSLDGQSDKIEDYGYDELLDYYFYPNGQCQESSRDQGHVLAGVHKYIEFAEIAWNQGDSFYSLNDNRLLKGIEFNYRYNLSYFLSFPDQPEPWEPSGYTADWNEVTLENNMYLQTKCRSGRWESIKPNPDKRGAISNVGSRTAAYAHYLVRAEESDEDIKWLKRAHEYTLDQYGYETSGTSPNWFYEWNGWGTLTKSLETWMAGDPVRYVEGKRISGIHSMPGVINAADYDYYNIREDGEGHTYHKVVAATPSAYRPDGGVSLKEVSGKWVVADFYPGEWLNYTVTCPASDTYDVYVTYRASSASLLSVAVSGGNKVTAEMCPSEEFIEDLIGTVEFPSGASVLRLFVENEAEGLEIDSIRVVYNSQYEAYANIEGHFDARSKQFTADWEFRGLLPEEIDLWRCPIGEDDKAQIIYADGSLGQFVDDKVVGTVPGYCYWISYCIDGEVLTTDRVAFEWGELNDTFENAESSEWSISGDNGEEEYSDGVFKITPNSLGTSRIGRGWSFPFHGGNYPILAFKMDRPEGLTMALYSGANSWNNGYETFDGCLQGNVYYYDLLNGSFQNNKGVDKTTLVTDNITTLPLQIRTVGQIDSEPLVMHWVRTFKSLDALKEFLDASDSVEEKRMDNCSEIIYNMQGIPCGKVPDLLPKGIYIISGRKIKI